MASLANTTATRLLRRHAVHQASTLGTWCGVVSRRKTPQKLLGHSQTEEDDEDEQPMAITIALITWRDLLSGCT